MKPAYIPPATRTSENMDIYVDGATGNDNTGDGSATAPYATIPRAYEDVPEIIAHQVRIYIDGAGSPYSDFPSDLALSFEEDGTLSFIGVGAPTEVAGPFAVNTFDAYHIWAGGKINVAGAGWTPDDWAGKFVRMNNGASAGYVLGAFHNDADDIWVNCPSYPPSPGDSISIVEPSITVETGGHVRIGSNTPRRYDTSDDNRLAFANLNLDMGASGVLSFEGGNTVVLPFVKILSRKSVNAVGSRNLVGGGLDAIPGGMVDGNGSGLTLGDYYQIPWWVWNPDGIDPSDLLIVAEGGPFVRNVCCRGKGSMVSYGEYKYSAISRVFSMDGAGRLLFSLLKGEGGVAFHVDACSSNDSKALHLIDGDIGVKVGGGAVEGIALYGCEDISSEGPMDSYGIEMGPMSRMYIDDSVSLSGATADILWQSNGATAAMPAADTLITDNRGAELYRKA